MSDLRTAAQQALNALGCLEYSFCGITDGPSEDTTEAAITALKAALTEPVQEPVAWLWQHRETGRTRLLMPNERTATDVAAAFDVVGPLYLAPPQRPVEPAQEPVAWDGTCVHGYCSSPTGCENDGECRGGAASPQRKPLTEQEIWHTYKNLWMFHPAEEPRLAGDVLKFARAIERAHGIV